MNDLRFTYCRQGEGVDNLFVRQDGRSRLHRLVLHRWPTEVVRRELL